jgi:hypothetical protein
MEISDVLSRLKKSEKTTPQFLALVMTDEVVQAAVWQPGIDQADIIATGTPVEWDGDTGTTSELVSAVDATVSAATEGVATDLTQIIFGVPTTWTDAKGLVGARRELIKNVCHELELKPLGFVVLSDSILRYLKMQEGTPATSLLIEVSRDEVIVILVKLGQIEGTQVVGRSDDIVADVEEGVSRLATGDNLPSRIIVFNSMHNLDDVVQNLVGNDWLAKFNFLHIPKVESLPKDIMIKAVAVAGGAEVAKSIGLTPTLTAPSSSSSAPVAPVESTNAEPPDRPEPIHPAPATTSTLETQNVEFVSPETAGFVIGLDTGSSSPVAPPSVTLVSDEPVSVSLDSTLTELDDLPRAEDEPGTEMETKIEPESESPVLPVSAPIPEPVVESPRRSPKLLTFPTIRLPRFAPSSSRWLLWAAVPLIVLTVFGLGWYTLPAASLTLTVATKPLTKSLPLTIMSDGSGGDSTTITATTRVETLSGQKTVPATGTKIIGDPARGEVTLYNRTSLTKTFAKGTKLKAGQLEFTLDQDVTVASKAAGADYVDIPGKATGKITAAAIGEASNLASGTEFLVASFSKDSYIAKNDRALSGGTAEEVKVISKTDLTSLAKALTDELVHDLDLRVGQSGEGNYVMAKSAKVVTESYTGKVGDAKAEVTGNLELAVKVLSYQTSDVEALLTKQSEAAIPPGFTRTTLPATVRLTDVTEESDGTVQGIAAVSLPLVPELDKAALAERLKGQSAGNIQAILSSVPGLVGADITLSPRWLPPRLKVMPRQANKITISIVPQATQ